MFPSPPHKGKNKGSKASDFPGLYKSVRITAKKGVVKMSEQNIFDNDTFFHCYQELRGNDANYNIQLEQPAMQKLLPDIKGKSVLDLGCGYGGNCVDFIKRGAADVIGVDISEKMLEIAMGESSDHRIQYIKMSMTDISELHQKFDLIYSSLAFHYIEDFEKLAKDAYRLLNEGGYLLFSQEHPLVTATFGGLQHYNKDPDGNYTSYTFSNYGQPGERVVSWFVDGIKKYHRRFSDIITALSGAGFMIDTVCEPLPEQSATEKIPNILVKEQIKPTFLIVKARKI